MSGPSEVRGDTPEARSARHSEARDARNGITGRWAPIVMIVAAVLVIAPARVARADVTADCEFFEISARTGDKAAMDAELSPVEKKLKKAPFSTWNQFKVLSHSKKSLTKKKTEPIGLKIGSATATLVEIVDKSKLRVTIAMDDGKGKPLTNTTTFDAGDYLIYVHPTPNNEGHLLSLTCR
jgi:hypothetical protein